jgi:hypothetical protein
MFRARAACGWSLFITFSALASHWPRLALAGIPLILASVLMTLIYIARTARHYLGTRYAIHQTALALLLNFLLLGGVWLIPSRIKSDLLKWHSIEEDHPPPA